MGGWNAPIDNYCERIGPSFWSEPLNAVTNLAFILAALLAWRSAARAGRVEWMVLVMVALALAVGTGSFLFHTFATRWAGAADTIPILLFILFQLFAATRRYFGAPWLVAAAAPALFMGFVPLFLAGWRALLPGIGFSEGYLPVLVALALYGLALRARRHPAAGWLLAAALVFAVSLTFRSIDGPVCSSFAQGTHFMWHLLNGLLLWIVIEGFVRHGAPLAAARARG